MNADQKIEKKRQKEMAVVTEMIALYCKGNHSDYHDGQLCPECAALAQYARSRSEHCPFMKTKTFCSNCTIHCYAPEMREKIRKVMRYSGPRMMLYHPLMCIWHVVTSTAEKRKLRK